MAATLDSIEDLLKKILGKLEPEEFTVEHYTWGANEPYWTEGPFRTRCNGRACFCTGRCS